LFTYVIYYSNINILGYYYYYYYYYYYSLTPWCRILFEKLIVTQLIKKYPASLLNRRFITVLTKARHWTISCYTQYYRLKPSEP